MFRKTHPAVLAAKCFSARKAGFCCGNCPEHEWASVLTVTWVGLCLDGHMSGPLSWRSHEWASVLKVTRAGLCLDGHMSGPLSWRSHEWASVLTVTRAGLCLDGHMGGPLSWRLIWSVYWLFKARTGLTACCDYYVSWLVSVLVWMLNMHYYYPQTRDR